MGVGQPKNNNPCVQSCIQRYLKAMVAWLQKRPQVSDPTMYYSIGLNKTVLVVGLGNPGEKYEKTRHNVGFLCVDSFVDGNDSLSGWTEKKNFKCTMASGQVADKQVIVIKPQTYMNKSGEAVIAVANFYNLTAADIVVIHDELDINFGQIRIRRGGSSAGHNGVSSISQQIGEDYQRIRVGIGPKRSNMKSEDYVLQNFSSDESGQLRNMTREVSAILSEYIYGSGDLVAETRNYLL
jgi:PTH1 family peptidyl-tRNA hydrolase